MKKNEKRERCLFLGKWILNLFDAGLQLPEHLLVLRRVGCVPVATQFGARSAGPGFEQKEGIVHLHFVQTSQMVNDNKAGRCLKVLCLLSITLPIHPLVLQVGVMIF